MASDAPDFAAFLNPLLCHNTETQSDGTIKTCRYKALFPCSNCWLVQYCSEECLNADSMSHRAVCTSKYMRVPYEPSWRTENRVPAFMSGPGLAHFGSSQYLWGNIPAVDVLNASENEGDKEMQQENMSLLFAASGDLRNVVKTINGLPESYFAECKVFINDINPMVALRNALLLLVATHLQPEVATPIMIHLWYSAMLPQEVIDALQEYILPLIRDICNTIKDEPEHKVRSEMFVHGKSSVTLTLRKSEWNMLEKMLVPCKTLTASEARTIRWSYVLARVDHIDRALYKMCPGRRSGAIEFRQNGILLPYGASRQAFTVPNPTFFVERTWPVKDLAEPLDGWSFDEYKYFAPVAKMDIYGALFFYLRHQLLAFCRRLHTFAIPFHLLVVEALDLPKCLPDIKFDRIEVSNICDRSWTGPERTLSTFSPLLKPRSQNRRATLLLCFLNVISEEERIEDHVTRTHRAHMVRKYFDFVDPRILNTVLGGAGPERPQCFTSPAYDLVCNTMTYWDDYDAMFARFASNVLPGSPRPVSLTELAATYGLRVKERHTIIRPWPYRASEHMTRDEFHWLLGENFCGRERYVELKRL